MYYPDLTPYEYFPSAPGEARLVNVGWLERGHEFTTGPINRPLIERLTALCKHRVNQTRGWHYCDLCDPPADEPISVTLNGEQISLGSAEIRLDGQDGVVYAAPNLILHYVSIHGYHPPQEFLTTLEQWDPATTPSRGADSEI